MTLDPSDIEHRQFRTCRRGFDPDEVRAFLASLADRVRTDSVDDVEALDRSTTRAAHELLDRAKYLAAAVVTEAEQRAARIEAEAAERAEQIAQAPGDDPMPWGDLGDQIAAILASAEYQAASMTLEAEVATEGLLSDAAAEAQRIRLEATSEAGRMIDDGRADLAYARALKERTEREVEQLIERAERATLERWNDADERIRSFAAVVMNDSLARVKALHAEISSAQGLLVDIEQRLLQPPDLDLSDPIDPIDWTR